MNYHAVEVVNFIVFITRRVALSLLAAFTCLYPVIDVAVHEML